MRVENGSLSIAVVGLSAVVPGAQDNEGFWKNIVQARDLISDVPPSHWCIADYYDPDPTAPDKTYCKRGGFLSALAFSPLEFGIPPNALSATDTSQLLGLVSAKRVLKQAQQGRYGEFDRQRISVILGMTSATELVVHMGARLQKPVWQKALRAAGINESTIDHVCGTIDQQYSPWQEATFPGLLGNVVAGRIANKLDLGGCNFVTDAACASSLSAINMAIDELLLGKTDLVISGGVDTLNDIFMYMCFSKTPALSPSGDCRPFSDQADGTLLGEGIAMFGLCRLEDAEEKGLPVYAVIKGIGSSSDGGNTSVYAPKWQGQAMALNRAYEQAHYSPSSVELVETHGTAIKAGDVAEFKGLQAVFAPSADERQWCAIGSIKSQLGHTKAAAGAVSLFKVICALHHKVLPPTIKVQQPNPQFKIETTPFYINTMARPWLAKPNHPRRASVSSFGFGGSNFHITLEEYSQKNNQVPRMSVRQQNFGLVSAHNHEELIQKVNLLCESKASFETQLQTLCQDFRSTHQYRLSFVYGVDEVAFILAKLKSCVVQENVPISDQKNIFYSNQMALKPKVALLFPGQGSQYVHMLADLLIEDDAIREMWDRCNRNYPQIAASVFPPPAFDPANKQKQNKVINEIENAHLSLALAEASLLHWLNAVELDYEWAVGHSFGELSAFYAAGIFSFEQFIDLSLARGQSLQQSVRANDSGMTAVQANSEQVEKLINEFSFPVYLANINSPKQVVVAGALQDLAEFESELARVTIGFKRLTVSAAFHTPLIEAACDKFAKSLAKHEFVPAQKNLVCLQEKNSAKHQSNVLEYLSRQIRQPVNFVEQIDTLLNQGVNVFIEVGPGDVLSGFVKTTIGDQHAARIISTNSRSRDALSSLYSAIAELAVTGVNLNYAKIYRQNSVLPRDQTNIPNTIPVAGNNIKPTITIDTHAAVTQTSKLSNANINSEVPKPMKQEHETVQLTNSHSSMDPEKHVSRNTTRQADNNGFTDLNEFHQRIANVHMTYQQTLSQSHEHFMHLTQQLLQSLNGTQNTEEMQIQSPRAYVPTQTSSRFEPALMDQPNQLSDSSFDYELDSAPVLNHHVSQGDDEGTNLKSNQSELIAPLLFEPTNATQPKQTQTDIAERLLQIVVEKTGYPREMINLEMDLERDLGIDSIKRVEILSTFKQQDPSVAHINSEQLGEFSTLASIVEYAQKSDELPVSELAPVGENTGTEPITHAVASPVMNTEGITQQVLRVVAEKTGYPQEMLSMEQSMEADLGIDSIKRVEILSVLAEQLNLSANMDSAVLSELNYLQDVANYIAQLSLGEETQVNVAQANTTHEQQVLQRQVSQLVSNPLEQSIASAINVKKAQIMTGPGEVATVLEKKLLSHNIEVLVSRQACSDVELLIYMESAHEVNSVQQAYQYQLNAFKDIQAVIKKNQNKLRAICMVQVSGGDFCLTHAKPMQSWNSAYAALLKTVAQEYTNLKVKCLDLAELSVNSLDQIVLEALFDYQNIEVSLGQDRKIIRYFEKYPVTMGNEPALNNNSVVIVTGGARGICADISYALAKKYGCRMALLGRTRRIKPNEELLQCTSQAEVSAWLYKQSERTGNSISLSELRKQTQVWWSALEVEKNLEKIATTGVELVYYSVDIVDQEAVTNVVSEICQNWGSIDAIIHGAGVLQDKSLLHKTESQFETVFQTKVYGLNNLLKATQNEQLKLLVCFSSVAAKYGNSGQLDYAMANETLSKQCLSQAEQRKKQCRVKSIAWGPWDGGMVNAGIKQKFAEMNINTIDLDAGVAAFLQEIEFEDAVDVIISAEAEVPYELPNEKLCVSLNELPYLKDHRMKGHYVLPFAQVICWINKYIEQLGKRYHALKIASVDVLKGIRLETANSIEWLTLVAEPLDDKQFVLKFKNDQGRICYRATLEFGHSPKIETHNTSDYQSWSLDTADFYHNYTFHGSQLQVISKFNWINETSGQCILRLHQPIKPDAPLDVSIIDGVLQAVLAWNISTSGQAAIPLSCEHVYVYKLPRDTTQFVATFFITQKTETGIHVNASITDVFGAPYFEIQNISAHNISYALLRNHQVVKEASSA